MIAMALVAGCGPKAATVEGPGAEGQGEGKGIVDPDESKDPLAAAVERIVTLYEAIATLPPAASCNDAATSIETWTKERADALAHIRDAAQGQQAALVDGLFHDSSERLADAMQKIEALATRCASEPALGEALTRLSTEAQR